MITVTPVAHSFGAVTVGGSAQQGFEVRNDGTADLSQAYENLCDTILQLLDARTVFILNWNGHGEQINTLSHVQEEEISIDLNRIAASFQNESPLRKEIEQGDPITITADQADSLPSPLREWFQESHTEHLLIAPLSEQKSVEGVIGLTVPQLTQDFTKGESDLVMKMADDLGELANDAHLLDQARTLVAVEERNRLARDLHDSVTQVLFSASLVAEVLPQIWQRNPDKALESLEELRRLTRGALAEMRTLLFELRPSALEATILSNLLRHQGDALTGRTRIPVALKVEGENRLPTEVKIAFYRITQEAFNNITKHSEATEVEVNLLSKPHQAELKIRDNGRGFDLQKLPEDKLGLRIMDERAEEVEAGLEVDSAPGEGTRISLIWPDSTFES